MTMIITQMQCYNHIIERRILKNEILIHKCLYSVHRGGKSMRKNEKKKSVYKHTNKYTATET